MNNALELLRRMNETFPTIGGHHLRLSEDGKLCLRLFDLGKAKNISQDILFENDDLVKDLNISVEEITGLVKNKHNRR